MALCMHMRYVNSSTSDDDDNAKSKVIKRQYAEITADVPPARQLYAEKKARINTYNTSYKR